MYDVIIIGGSYAGMSAALQLARARRSVLVVDAGKRRNRTAVAAHGLLGFDGVSPDAIAEAGRRDVLAYPTVTWREGTVRSASGEAEGFEVVVDDERLRGRRLILATGITDELPSIPGVSERWGKTVFHCPYCHGYELERGELGVLAVSPHSFHHAVLVSDWSAPGGTTFFLDGGFELDAQQRELLEQRRVRLEPARVRAVSGESSLTVELEDGRRIDLAGLFLPPHSRVNEALVSGLGCALEQGPMGAYIKIDPLKQTSVRGVFACGDVALPAGALTFALAEGAMAGISAHRSLVFGL